MKIKTLSLLAVAATVAVLWPVSAFAQYPPCPTCVGDPWEMANEELLSSVPVSAWLDDDAYNMGDVLVLTGHVANIMPEYPILLQVIDPLGNVALVNQVDVDDNGDFEVLLSSASWTMEGLYSVEVQYGEPHRNNKVQFTLSEALGDLPVCGPSMLYLEETCIMYDIAGGSITDAYITDNSSIMIEVSADSDGMLAVEFPVDIVSDIFLILVDGEEHNDVYINGQMVEVMFPAGSGSIEILATYVVPEFGVMTALILGVAIISMVAITAKSGLISVPRF